MDWDVLKRYGLGLVLGATLGAVTADLTPGPTLRVGFGLFAWAMALQLAFGGQPSPLERYRVCWGCQLQARSWADLLYLASASAMTVPYLIFHNVATKRAVGTSAAAGSHRSRRCHQLSRRRLDAGFARLLA